MLENYFYLVNKKEQNFIKTHLKQFCKYFKIQVARPLKSTAKSHKKIGKVHYPNYSQKFIHNFIPHTIFSFTQLLTCDVSEPNFVHFGANGTFLPARHRLLFLNVCTRLRVQRHSIGRVRFGFSRWRELVASSLCDAAVC